MSLFALSHLHSLSSGESCAHPISATDLSADFFRAHTYGGFFGWPHTPITFHKYLEALGEVE
jgi:hypothetical protein